MFARERKSTRRRGARLSFGGAALWQLDPRRRGTR